MEVPSAKGPNRPVFDWTELPSRVVEVIAEIFITEHETSSPLCDTSDMAKTAGACMVIGNPSSIKGIASFSQLGRMLYAAISPRLGAETGVTDQSSKPTLLIKLKEWNLFKSGNEAVMLKRINDQVTPCHETACPCAIATRTSMAAFRQERFRLMQAMQTFGLSQKEVRRVPFIDRNIVKKGAPKRYSRQCLKEAAQIKCPLWGDFKRLKDKYARRQEEIKLLREEWEVRKLKVVDALVGEEYGYERQWAVNAVKQSGHLPYLCCYLPAAVVPAGLEGLLGTTVPIVAENVEEVLKAKQAQQAQQEPAQQQVQQAESELDDDDDVEEGEEEEEAGGLVDDGVGGTSSTPAYPDFIPF